MSKSNGKDHREAEMERKFAEFDRLIAESKKNGVQAVVVPSPQTLGDTYEELIRNLTKLQEAGLSLVIAVKEVIGFVGSAEGIKCLAAVRTTPSALSWDTRDSVLAQARRTSRLIRHGS